MEIQARQAKHTTRVSKSGDEDVARVCLRNTFYTTDDDDDGIH